MSRSALAFFSVVLVACGASAPAPPPVVPMRSYYVSPSAPACADDDSDMGAALAALRFDDGGGASGPVPPGRVVLVRASRDCTVQTRLRVLRLSTSESFAESCTPDEHEACAFVRACWAVGGPEQGACEPGDHARALELFALLASEGRDLPGVLERDPAASVEAPTVYVETGTRFYGQGHLVQRVEGVWRVVLSSLVWQA